MSLKTLSLTAAAFLSIGTAANATTLVSGPLYAGTNQNNATCYLFNGGNSSIALPQILIIGNAGLQPPKINTCVGSLLAPGTYCGVNVAITSTDAVACKIIVNPDGVDLQGNLQVRNGLTVLQNTPVE
jgi:hypothetical protein